MSDPEEFGSYLVYDQLGVGGMASVHLAESRSIGGFRKRVALKRLLPHAAEDPDLVEAFIGEARLVRYLKHANVAQTYDFGKVGDIYFIAMEFVSGATLTQLMRQCVDAAGLIPVPIVLAILIQLCDALDHAHNLCDEYGEPLGIIHRDVSPPNVIVSNTGLVKLIDFGIAKAAVSRVETQVGIIKGKYSYVAPEYLAGKIDPRADLWAAGVIAHELLTTERLFDGPDDYETIRRVREMKIAPPSLKNREVPHDLDDIVMTALARDPESRWQSAAAMRNALTGVMKELGTVVTNQQVIAWVEWAFTQEPPTGLTPRPTPTPNPNGQSGLSDLIAILENPSTPRVKPDTPPSARPVKKGRSTLWVMLLVLAAVAAAAAAVAWLGVPV